MTLDPTYFHRLVSALGPNDDGLTDAEVEEIEQRYGFTFPPELRALLQYCVPFSTGPHAFPNWRVDSDHLRVQLDAPLQGLLFDVEQNDWWWKPWGERPPDLDQALAVATACFAVEPRLIPVFGHRYMPSTSEPSAPVLSVHQADVIYYGFTLPGYFRNEFSIPIPPDGATEPQRVRFWGEIADANGDGPRDWWNYRR